MFDKFKSCENCPDRTIEPNYHGTCEGYLFGVEESEKRRKLRRKDFDYYDFKKDTVAKTKKYSKK